MVSQDQVYQLVQVLLQEDLLFHLASNVHKLPFETRKDTQIIISLVLRFKNPGVGSQEPPAIHYIVEKRPELIIALCNGYNQRESAMPCGGILREALKHDVIAALILYDEADAHPEPLDVTRIDTTVVASGRGVFWKFFSWIDAGSFEVSADAFNTFRVSVFRIISM